jgi:uncharacterized protein
MIEKEQISSISDTIVREIDPEKIILFGSYASGNYDSDSDLDLIIIKKTSLPKHKRGLQIRRLFYRQLIPMDLKIYTPEEFERELNNRYSFLHNAIINSKILYERPA